MATSSAEVWNEPKGYRSQFVCYCCLLFSFFLYNILFNFLNFLYFSFLIPISSRPLEVFIRSQFIRYFFTNHFHRLFLILIRRKRVFNRIESKKSKRTFNSVHPSLADRSFTFFVALSTRQFIFIYIYLYVHSVRLGSAIQSTKVFSTS